MGRPSRPRAGSIMVLTCMQEAGTGFASKPQTDDALDSWVRYDDPEVKAFKLNAERQNGRAAMLGIKLPDPRAPRRRRALPDRGPGRRRAPDHLLSALCGLRMMSRVGPAACIR